MLLNNARSIAVLLQVRQRLSRVLLGIVQDHDFGGIVLKQVNDNSVSNAGTGASDNVDLCRFIQVSRW